VLLRHPFRVFASCLALSLAIGMLCPAVRGDDNDKPKKKEKIEPWVEVRTANFVVASDGGERIARHVADQFELLRRVFQATMPNARLSTGIPIQILAARDGKSFAKLFPEFPYDKRRSQPNGQFIAGPEKIYIGIRTNASGPAPYADIYREYARLVLKLSYRSLPPWLEDGYSDVFGSLILKDNGALLGRPVPEDLSVLFESPLLPLDLVMHVDRNSPYYTSGDRMTVYAAESRVLVHFLLTDPQIAATKALDRYIARVEGGADSLEAAKQVFGDLNHLQSKLDTYIKQTKAPPSEIATASGSDSGGPAKTLSAAETEALMGDFSAARGRRDDAQDMLEDALKLDPSLADAEQSMGYLLLQQNQIDDAEKHFTRASQLNPNDALSYYGEGLVAMTRGGFVGIPVGAVVAFEKTISLNPNFAPAWYNLASIYAQRPETLQKALADAQRAASLAPGESGYQLQVANILESLGRIEDARKAATSVQASSIDPQVADKAADLLARMSQQQKPAPMTSKSGAPASSSIAGTLRIENKTEPEEPKPAAIREAPRTEPNPPPPPAIAFESQVYSMVGTITDVICAHAPQIQFTLKAQFIAMKLHSDDLRQVAIKTAGSKSLLKDIPCGSLQGRTARVSYKLVRNKTWDGEMQTVEIR
jgi:tetratricopeptide (TPR) repeat protein